MDKYKDGTDVISIDQQDSITEFLNIHSAKPIKNITSPMTTNYIDPDSEPLSNVDMTTYQSIVGSLNYFAMYSRWDISYAANRLCQDNNKPTQASWKAMRRVLSYLLATNDFKITGKFMSGNNNLKSYSGSNIADDNSATTRSQTGTMIMLNNVPIHWKSKTQCKTSKSPAQAEIYALSNTLDDARDMRFRLHDLNITVNKRLTIYTDNTQAEAFTKSTCVRSRLRGVFSRHEGWVRELKEDGELDCRHVAAKYNAANIFTKPLVAVNYSAEKRLISEHWIVAA